MHDYEVARKLAVQAPNRKAAAVEFFRSTGETPDRFGSTVEVDGQFVVVYPADVDPGSVKVCPSCIGGRLTEHDCVPCGNTGHLPISQDPARSVANRAATPYRAGGDAA